MGRSLARPTWDLPGVETLNKLEDLLHKVRCHVAYTRKLLHTRSTQSLTIARIGGLVRRRRCRTAERLEGFIRNISKVSKHPPFPHVTTLIAIP